MTFKMTFEITGEDGKDTAYQLREFYTALLGGGAAVPAAVIERAIKEAPAAPKLALVQPAAEPVKAAAAPPVAAPTNTPEVAPLRRTEGDPDYAMRTINAKELSKYKLSELSAFAATHPAQLEDPDGAPFSVSGLARPQIEACVYSLVFSDGIEARTIRAEADAMQGKAAKAPAKAAKAEAATKKAPAAPAPAAPAPQAAKLPPKPAAAPAPAAKVPAPPAAKPAPAAKVLPAPSRVSPDHIPEDLDMTGEYEDVEEPEATAPAVANTEPDYSGLLPEDMEDEEGAAEYEDEPEEEEGAAFVVDPNDIPEFLKTAPKLTQIVTGLAAKHKVYDPDKLVEILRAYAPHSPKIQQSIDSIVPLRIKGILSMVGMAAK